MNQLDFVHHYIPGDADSSRVLLLLHGTGGDESSMLTLGREFDAQATLLSPRGQVLENGMPRFFRRFAEGRFDEDDLSTRAHSLADFVAAARDAYGLAAQVAPGLPNRANMSAALLPLSPAEPGGAVRLRHM